MTTARESAVVLYGAAADRPDEADGVVQAEAIAGALSRLGWRADLMPLDLDLSALSSPRVRRAALLFNVVDSLAGDSRLGPVVPGVLAVLGLPYTGCDATSQLAATNKCLAKRLMRSEAIPTPPWSHDGGGFAAGDRVIVKSVWEHASVGLDAGSVVEARDARRTLAARAARFGGEWFVERYVEGREFNIAMLQSASGVEVLPAAEIEFVDFPPERPRIVDYEAKWIASSFAYHRTPRRFVLPTDERSLVSRLCTLARQCWSLFGLAGYARVDFRVDGDGAPWVIDVNANPCLSPDAGFAAAAQAAGIDYDAVVARIAASARTRAGDLATVA
jgi:D-alanine-D-alanine ligase